MRGEADAPADLVALVGAEEGADAARAHVALAEGPEPSAVHRVDLPGRRWQENRVSLAKLSHRDCQY